MNQTQIDQVVAALPHFAPNIIYAIANEALCGAFDGVDSFKGSAEVFLACWHVELTNNGPFRFIQAINPDLSDRASALIDAEY